MVEEIKREPRKKSAGRRMLDWCSDNLGKIIVGLDIVAGAFCIGAIGHNIGVKRSIAVVSALEKSGLVKAHHFDGTEVNQDSVSDMAKWEHEADIIVKPKKKK